MGEIMANGHGSRGTLRLAGIATECPCRPGTSGFLRQLGTPGAAVDSSCWRVDRPFVIDGLVVGRIVAQGSQDNGVETQVTFLEFTDTLGSQIERLVTTIPSLAPVTEPVELVTGSVDSVGFVKS